MERVDDGREMETAEWISLFSQLRELSPAYGTLLVLVSGVGALTLLCLSVALPSLPPSLHPLRSSRDSQFRRPYAAAVVARVRTAHGG